MIVRPDNTIASLGFNGFPRGIDDAEALLEQREEKYKRVIHAEMNALLFLREPAFGYTLYTEPLPPCNRCIVHVIQAGIKRVVAPRVRRSEAARWAESCQLSEALAREAGIILDYL